MSDFGVEMSMMSAADGDAIVAHPDAVLRFNEMWTCSCGMTAATFGPMTYNGVEIDGPVKSWCVHCGEVAWWTTEGQETSPTERDDS